MKTTKNTNPDQSGYELTDDDLEQVSGGFDPQPDPPTPNYHRVDDVAMRRILKVPAGLDGTGVRVIYAGAQVSTSSDDAGNLQIVVEQAAELGYRRTVADIARGTGPASLGLRVRHGTGAGNLPKRG